GGVRECGAALDGSREGVLALGSACVAFSACGGCAPECGSAAQGRGEGALARWREWVAVEASGGGGGDVSLVEARSTRGRWRPAGRVRRRIGTRECVRRVAGV